MVPKILNHKGFNWSKETFEKKRLEYQEKFERLVKYVEKNKKFPEFIEDPEVKKVKAAKNFFFLNNNKNYNYFEFGYFHYMTNYEKFSSLGFFGFPEEDVKILHNHYLKQFDYAKENLIHPARIGRFNQK